MSQLWIVTHIFPLFPPCPYTVTVYLWTQFTFDVWSLVYPITFQSLTFVCQHVIDRRAHFVRVVFNCAWHVIGPWLKCLVDGAPRFVGGKITRRFRCWSSNAVHLFCIVRLKERAQWICCVRDGFGTCSGWVSSQRQDLLGRQKFVLALHRTQPLFSTQAWVDFFLIQLR